MRYLRFWLRELCGWLLVGLGLFGFYICFVLILNRYIWETGPASLISIILFRGGIHLLKVAVAARICLQANEQLTQRASAPPLPPATTRPRRKMTR